MSTSPDVGARAPDFTLPSTQGPITLSDRLKKRAVLLVFYPGDDTPVCTKQLCDYSEHLADFEGLGVDVLALNPQSLASHERFASKHALTFPLLSDAGAEVCRSYDAVGLFGMTRRALVLIGKDGRVLWRRTDLPIFRRSAEELRAKITELRLDA
jgi:peroxiredoxin